MRYSAIFILFLLLVTGCGSARRGVPLLGPMEMKDPTVMRGEQVFMSHCNSCHPRGEAGIGLALNNKRLPDWAIRTQVRLGLGAMPGFTENVISEKDLEAIVAYLQYMRERGHGVPSGSYTGRKNQRISGFPKLTNGET